MRIQSSKFWETSSVATARKTGHLILMISQKTLEGRSKPSFSDHEEAKLRKNSLMARNNLAMAV